jgi:hypothetical protein
MRVLLSSGAFCCLVRRSAYRQLRPALPSFDMTTEGNPTMEFASLNNRNVTGTAVADLRKAISRMGELKSDRRMATNSRRAVIDAEMRRLNEHCETITHGRG